MRKVQRDWKVAFTNVNEFRQRKSRTFMCGNRSLGIGAFPYAPSLNSCLSTWKEVPSQVYLHIYTSICICAVKYDWNVKCNVKQTDRWNAPHPHIHWSCLPPRRQQNPREILPPPSPLLRTSEGKRGWCLYLNEQIYKFYNDFKVRWDFQSATSRKSLLSREKFWSQQVLRAYSILNEDGARYLEESNTFNGSLRCIISL